MDKEEGLIFLKSTYDEALDKLKKGERPQFHLKEEILSFCCDHWEELNKQKSHETNFLPMLCILDHSKKGSLKFVQPIIETIHERREKDLIVYTLSASHKVILEECVRLGERVPFDFIKALKVPLKSKEPEVVEWTLRTIEALGHQSIILKDDVLQAKPGLLALFNEHRKNSKDLIEYLSRRWEGRL